jgi:heterodisulfide reductase subunit A
LLYNFFAWSFGAIELKEEERQFEEIMLRTRKSYVNPALCKGCGACIPECPVGAMTQKHFTSAQIEAMLREVGAGISAMATM